MQGEVAKDRIIRLEQTRQGLGSVPDAGRGSGVELLYLGRLELGARSGSESDVTSSICRQPRQPFSLLSHDIPLHAVVQHSKRAHPRA